MSDNHRHPAPLEQFFTEVNDIHAQKMAEAAAAAAGGPQDSARLPSVPPLEMVERAIHAAGAPIHLASHLLDQLPPQKQAPVGIQRINLDPNVARLSGAFNALPTRELSAPQLASLIGARQRVCDTAATVLRTAAATLRSHAQTQTTFLHEVRALHRAQVGVVLTVPCVGCVPLTNGLFCFCYSRLRVHAGARSLHARQATAHRLQHGCRWAASCARGRGARPRWLRPHLRAAPHA